MIYPARATILWTAAGIPPVLLVAAFAPGRWMAGLAWPMAVAVLAIVDAVRGTRPSAARLTLDTPRFACVGGQVDARIAIVVPGIAVVELVVETGPELANGEADGVRLRLQDGGAVHPLPLTAVRRGTGTLPRAWLRWRGPLGLVWKQRMVALDGAVAIGPDIRPARDRAQQIIRREALEGLVTQRERSDGTDFDAMVEYRAGLDRRAIDWKQSARHVRLVAKQYRAERNSQIVFAIDAGRQMAEPVAGLTRLDRMVAAALLTAWIALRLGDRVALHAFDARPRIAGGLVSGVGAFAEVQRLAALVSYSGEETNHGLALTTLAARLTRRSLIVLFTEFTDAIAADFLVRAGERLMRTHLLLLVVLRDEELEAIVAHAPDTADDVARAVTAAALLKDRQLVLTRLRHLGAHVIESPHDQVADRLASGYADLKRRSLL